MQCAQYASGSVHDGIRCAPRCSEADDFAGRSKYVSPAPIENGIGGCPLVEACCVTGVGFPQPFAILMPAPQVWERGQSPEQRSTLEQALQIPRNLRDVAYDTDIGEFIDARLPKDVPGATAIRDLVLMSKSNAVDVRAPAASSSGGSCLPAGSK